MEGIGPGNPLSLEIMLVFLVTEDVVLIGLKPFIEEQVVGLESFRKFGI